MKKILIVDDDRSIRHILKEALARDDYHTEIMQDAESALKAINKNSVDLIITDLMMPGMTGLEMMEKVKEGYPDIGFIFMTAFGTVDVAVDALKKGAKPMISNHHQLSYLQLSGSIRFHEQCGLMKMNEEANRWNQQLEFQPR